MSKTQTASHKYSRALITQLEDKKATLVRLTFCQLCHPTVWAPIKWIYIIIMKDVETTLAMWCCAWDHFELWTAPVGLRTCKIYITKAILMRNWLLEWGLSGQGPRYPIHAAQVFTTVLWTNDKDYSWDNLLKVLWYALCVLCLCFFRKLKGHLRKLSEYSLRYTHICIYAHTRTQ